MAAIPIDPERVRELFTYDPDTGVLRWAKPSCVRIKPGDLAGGLKSNDPLFRYWVVRMDGKRYRRSRLVWAHWYGEDPGDDVDHRDRDKANDRIANLRLATHTQNMVNTVFKKTVHHGMPRGVAPKLLRGKFVGYRGRANINGRRVDLGPYSTAEKAGEAVRRRLASAHGAEWLPTHTGV